MSKLSSRKASHAGSWYSSDGSKLERELGGWLDKAEQLHSPARAIIAPSAVTSHAGYSYSGRCGGFAYRQIDPALIQRVFILGPSHHVYLPTCALSPSTHCKTPLYDLKIDQNVYTELRRTGQFDTMSQGVDEDEHSIEMHLPYVAKVMKARKGSFTIVPVLVGGIKAKQEKEFGKIFSPYLADPENLFVISSDFCHWGKRFSYTPYDEKKGPIHTSIEALDREGMDCISALDANGFSKYIEDTRNTVCGRHPIGVLLNAVNHLQSSQPGLTCKLKFICYEQSSSCKSMADSSVSYASASLVIQ